MVKKILIFTVSVCMLCVVQGHAVQEHLSPDEVGQAAAFGRKQAASAEQTLQVRYRTGGCGAYEVCVIVRSKWYKIALMAARSSLLGNGITPGQQEQILGDRFLQIDVVVYGRRLDFARNYTVTMVQQGRSIRPDKTHADHFQNPLRGRKAMEGFPCCRATIRNYFRYDRFDSNGRAELAIRRDGKETRVALDFGRFK